METKVSIRLRMKNNISEKQLREFGLIIGIFFPIIIGWLLPYLYGHGFRYWTLIFISFPFFVLGVFSPENLYYPYKLWMKIGKCAEWINSHLILGLIFVILVQPLALLLKIFNYDPLNMKKNKKNSFKLKKTDTKINLKKMF